MAYQWFKTLHVVAIIAWMSGLFYVGRIFVNHEEALAQPEPARGILHAQLAGMARRAYRGILTPAIVLSVAFAVGMLAVNPALLGEGWLHAKLALVLVLAAYHGYCGRLLKQLAAGHASHGSLGFRILNEVPTVLMLAIVLLAVFKQLATPTAMAQALGGLLVLLVLGIGGYARKRARAAQASSPGAARPTARGGALAGGMG